MKDKTRPVTLVQGCRNRGESRPLYTSNLNSGSVRPTEFSRPFLQSQLLYRVYLRRASVDISDPETLGHRTVPCHKGRMTPEQTRLTYLTGLRVTGRGRRGPGPVSRPDGTR